ncbi:MAG: DUF1328 domain-containing protein [Minicystis sp.]
MLRWSIGFFVLALVAAVLGFSGLSADAAWLGKLLFGVFLVIAVCSFFFGRRAAA